MRAWSRQRFSQAFDAVRLSLRAALAASLAVALAGALGLEHPLYAMIAAVLVTDLSVERTRQLGRHRLAGTVVGATVGALLSRWVPSGPATIGLGILLAMSLSHLLRMPGAVKLAGYLCGIVLLEHHDHPWTYALFRLVETTLGIAVAWLVSLVPKLVDGPDSGPDGS